MSENSSDAAPVTAEVDADDEKAADPSEAKVSKRTHPSRRRRWGVMVLVVLTAFGVLTSTVAVWAHRMIFNTDEWVATVGPLIDDPEITQAVSTRLVDEILVLIDADDVITDVLPDKAQVLAPVLESTLRNFLIDQVDSLLQTEQAQTIWVEGNRKAHALVVDVLQGNNVGPVLLADGEVALNLMPLVSKALVRVDDRFPDLLPLEGPVPEVTADTPIPEAQQQFATAFGKTLKPDFGVVVVFQSDQLGAAQDAVTLFDRGVVALIVITLAMAVGAVALAADRRAIALRLGIAVVAAAAVGIALINAVQQLVLDMIGNREGRRAVAHLLASVTSSFDDIARLLLAGGLLVAAISFLAGPNTAATQTRDVVRRTAQGAPPSWLAQHLGALQGAGGAIAIALVLLGGLSWTSLLWVAAFLAVWELALWLIGRRIAPAGEPGTDASDAAVDPPVDATAAPAT